MIGPGAPAPDFELPDQDGEPLRLSALRGRAVVLYFHPEADPPGRCSRCGAGAAPNARERRMSAETLHR